MKTVYREKRYGREVTTPGDEIDEGLAELNQKKQDKAGGLLPYRRSLRSLPRGGSFYGSRRGFRPLGALSIRTR